MKLYIVEDTTSELFGQSEVVAVLSKKQYFLEFVIRESVRRHQEHFENWCKCHDFLPNDFNAMAQYLAASFPDEIGHFVMHPARLTRDQVAQVFRLAHRYRPLGASYESEGERLLKQVLEEKEVEDKQKLDK